MSPHPTLVTATVCSTLHEGGVVVLPPHFPPLVALESVTMRVTWSLLRCEAKNKLNCTFGLFNANGDNCCLTSHFSADATCTIYGISLCCCHLLFLLRYHRPKSCRAHVYRSLWFKHYNFEQLKQIIRTRLGGNDVFEPVALSVAVHEVSQTHVSLSTHGMLTSVIPAGIITILLHGQKHSNKTSIQQPPHCLQHAANSVVTCLVSLFRAYDTLAECRSFGLS